MTGSVSTKRQRKSLVSSESLTGEIQDAERVEKLPGPAIIITTPWPKGNREGSITSIEVHPPALEAAVEKMEGADLKVKMEVPKMEEPTKRPQKRVKGLKMPDGTYVGIKDKNKYLR
ncbi:hypothetical protein IscW_ISCW017317 [Ixodes scapularis]|uniref:Uncharacterized protein n=1 Tax=Ixodes scapularis TaxID=6945 RepID=B7P9Y4_IXOSC|nr:hypothetical protein IscW_ISCW017317 [Ixodes scapularis]|eukprot:XP_002405850.1 hypothetical protein IscW_ISCW017317 [Ixodes scapularis]